MIRKIANTLKWLPYYLHREFNRNYRDPAVNPKHIYFCICDHFEPYWNKADRVTAKKRIHRWMCEYPKIAERYPDSDGRSLNYTFFYPEEEYQEEDMNELAKLCQAGFGEVEIHLHHDNDTSKNLRSTLVDYKNRLYEKHGLLSKSRHSGEISYGFIHGNWALANSRHDGRWCGVNDEISILQETGCYADFTLPSAPSETQTRKVNSIYYAVDESGKPKSHDWGVNAEVGKKGEGLLMVQGPLCLTWKHRKSGFLPGIENGGLFANNPPTLERIHSWVNTGISVDGAGEHVFVKIYTHGTQEGIMEMLFDDNNLSKLFSGLHDFSEENGGTLHYVSARELTNVVLAIQNSNTINVTDMRDCMFCR